MQTSVDEGQPTSVAAEPSVVDPCSDSGQVAPVRPLAAPLTGSERYLDREQSWLAFNERVLWMAEDPAVPLLDRVRFLGIFATNLDEFFMVRVAGLNRRLATGLSVQTTSGLSHREQLERLRVVAHDLAERHDRLFHDELLPALAGVGITISRWHELSDAEREQVHPLFRDRVRPILTPLAVDPAHPFPYISGLSLNLAVVVRDPDTLEERFARVKVPATLPRFVPVADHRYVPLEDIIAAHLPELFDGMTIVSTHSFRVTRNEDLEVDEEGVDDLLAALERELLQRRFGPPVRLEVADTMSAEVLDLLMRELDMTQTDVYRLRGPLDLTGLLTLPEPDRSDLRWPTFVPRTQPRLAPDIAGVAPDVFRVLREDDVLVQHPYDPFSTSVQSFLEQAASDDSVRAIKQTLYRTSGDSPIVEALIAAVESGKQVLVLVELKARFEEHANIRWARALEQAGCHVVYGLVGLKTHCKLALVVREESDGRLRRYAHIGTGNYNPRTARIYEDLGLLTADPELTTEVSDLFDHLSGYTRQRNFSRLLVAPDSLRPGILGLISDEIVHHEAGRPAGIRMKMNSLVDETVIDALYDASAAGVPVDLVVRGMCALRPGVPELSEHIRVRSVIGRFLEHSRILDFQAGGERSTWIGSADMMHRNLDRRVEAMVRVDSPTAKQQIDGLLTQTMSAETRAWHLGADGRYTLRGTVDLQVWLIDRPRPRAALAETTGDVVLGP